jgi:hypothetical protein
MTKVRLRKRDALPLFHTYSFMAWTGKALRFYLLRIFTAIKNVRDPAGRILTQNSM